MILIQRLIDRGHLPLTKRVIQRVVDRRHADPQSRRGIPIDIQASLQTFVLLIGIHVDQAGNLAHFPQQLIAPDAQFFQAVASQRVLILSTAGATANPQILHWLQNQCRPRQP